MRSYFVTGTDTGVGKTFVAVCLLREARARGMRTAALKPAETGCARDATTGALLPADGLLLRAAAGREELPIEIIVPHRYLAPVAPAVAARHEGRPFSIDRVLAARQELGAVDFLVIEGAGGLLVPFGDNLLAADVARHMSAPVLIVARAGLGTINHSLLTVFEARRRGLVVAAVILNQRGDADAADAAEDPSVADNAEEIRRHGDVVVLGPGAIDFSALF